MSGKLPYIPNLLESVIHLVKDKVKIGRGGANDDRCHDALHVRDQARDPAIVQPQPLPNRAHHMPSLVLGRMTIELLVPPGKPECHKNNEQIHKRPHVQEYLVRQLEQQHSGQAVRQIVEELGMLALVEQRPEGCTVFAALKVLQVGVVHRGDVQCVLH